MESSARLSDSNVQPQVIVHGDATGFAQSITARNHHLQSDEPQSAGGTDTGPNPYDLLLAALGSCTSMTVAMYASASSGRSRQ